MTDDLDRCGFVAPGPLLPPARYLSSRAIGSLLGVLRRLPRLAPPMLDWMLDARAELIGREHAQPRTFEVVVNPNKPPLRFAIDDSLADVERTT